MCGNQERVCYLAWHCCTINCVKSSRFERPPFRNKLCFHHEYINLCLFIYLFVPDVSFGMLSSSYILLFSRKTWIWEPLPTKGAKQIEVMQSHPGTAERTGFCCSRALLAPSPSFQSWDHRIITIITPPCCPSSASPPPALHPWLRQRASRAWVSVLFLQLFVNLCVALGRKEKLNSFVKPLGNAWHSLSPSHSLLFSSWRDLWCCCDFSVSWKQMLITIPKRKKKIPY